MRDLTPADVGFLESRSWADLEAAGALPPFIAEHAARPARYVPTEQEPETWPFCRRAEEPHDGHMDNGGNTWCPGAPGTMPPTPLAQHVADLARALEAVGSANARFLRAENDLRHARVVADRHRALVSYARSLEEPDA